MVKAIRAAIWPARMAPPFTESQDSMESPDHSRIEVIETSSLSDLKPALEKMVFQRVAETSRVVSNTDQSFVLISIDRLGLYLRDYRDALESRQRWQAPAGILASLVGALVASDFRNLWIDAAVWKALFILASLTSAYHLVRALIQAFGTRSRSDELENLLDRLAKEKSTNRPHEP